MKNLQREIEKTGLTVNKMSEALKLKPEEFLNKLQTPEPEEEGFSLGEGVKLADLIKAKGGNGCLSYLYRPQ